MDEEARALALRVRERCLEVLSAAYEEAGMSGLCAEGRWELALDRLRSLSAAELLQDPERGSG